MNVVRRFVCSLGLSGVLAVAFVGCASPATQFDLTVSTSCPLRTDRELLLRVTDHDGVERPFLFNAVRWPFRQTLTPRGGDTSRTRWRVDAILRDAEDAVLDMQTLSGEYVPGTNTSGNITLRDPACIVADAGMDAGEIDAPGELDAFVSSDAGVDASPDAGRRVTADLLLAYRFRVEALGDECAHRADLGLGDAVTTAGSTGLVLTGGQAVSALVPNDALMAMESAFSIEVWVDVDPSLPLDRTPNMLTFYDSTSWYQHVRLLVGPAFGPSLEPDPSALEVLGAVQTTRTGDSYGRPYRAARVANRFTGPSPIHFVYTYAGDTASGDEHIYINGVEATGSGIRWITEGAGTSPPRAGAAQLRGNTRLWLGNSPSFGQARAQVDANRADVGAFDAGVRNVETPPDPATQFRGTYRLLAVYGRQLTATQVARHFALGPDANPCGP